MTSTVECDWHLTGHFDFALDFDGYCNLHLFYRTSIGLLQRRRVAVLNMRMTLRMIATICAGRDDCQQSNGGKGTKCPRLLRDVEKSSGGYVRLAGRLPDAGGDRYRVRPMPKGSSTQPSVRRARELPNLAIGHHHGPSSRRSADEEAINIRSWSVWVRLLCLVRPVIDDCGV